jgi:hypothetical protein
MITLTIGPPHYPGEPTKISTFRENLNRFRFEDPAFTFLGSRADDGSA